DRDDPAAAGALECRRELRERGGESARYQHVDFGTIGARRSEEHTGGHECGRNPLTSRRHILLPHLFPLPPALPARPARPVPHLPHLPHPTFLPLYRVVTSGSSTKPPWP